MAELAIVGLGKMGKLIEQLAPDYGFQVRARLDIHPAVGTDANLDGVDVAIEFTVPEAVVGNVEKFAAKKIPLVIGTTGWLEHLDRVKSIVESNESAMVWSPNFSIGVNVFQRLVAEAARLLESEREYAAWAWEIHHSAKKDAPSGTLLKLVSEMKKAGYARAIDVSSNRAGAHPGTHEIGFDSTADTITLRHTARSREGFARGALKAAQWIMGRKGCYEFSDVLFGR
ncbi:MAG TPA: dihydrodipicolinate reductase C-terminal domain-containing protein [Bryobacteraceae bacterium]|jgi:4-hydroxy-tetrahydrodipicolinate reductase|nr:dihydrodipicolinate reductase C-terminal domain-containing protein [Bryobacteraceae bacterium]